MVLSRLRRTIHERGLLYGGERVIVACSGGPDSMALLDLLSRLESELKLELIAAGVDHGLREEAAKELALVEREASRREIEFVALSVEVRQGASLQDAARDARYAALLELKRDRRADKIAIGQHLDDQAETVLQRILRGGGLSGLAGIEPAREDGVIRPLIDIPRADLLAHLKRFDIPFALDPSNLDPRHARVRIREELLPALSKEDPQIALHLSRLADEARAYRARERAAIDYALAQIPRGESVELDWFEAAPEHLRGALLAAFIQKELPIQLSRPHREFIAGLIGGPGEVLLPEGHRILRVDRRIVLDTTLLSQNRSRIEDA